MNIIFFGSSEFSVPSLKALLSLDHKVACVVTQPDKEKGRGLEIAPTAVKKIAQENQLRCYQPENINSAESMSFLKSLDPDLFVVIAYGQIFSQAQLNVPKKFALNLHASLLPKYRGAAPINWVIINAENETGVTAMKMVRKMDSGPIILQKSLKISQEDTAIDLSQRLSVLSAEVLVDFLSAAQNDSWEFVVQDESQATLAPKLSKEDGRINWDKPAYCIYNLIRGALPWPGAFTYYNGKLLKLYKASVVTLSEHKPPRGGPGQSTSLPEGDHVTSPGEIVDVSMQGISVATGDVNLRIEELQLEGRKRTFAWDFAQGYRIKPGERFESRK